MELKRMMNSTEYKLIVNQEELNELEHGLGWSQNESGEIDEAICEELRYQLKEFVTE